MGLFDRWTKNEGPITRAANDAAEGEHKEKAYDLSSLFLNGNELPLHSAGPDGAYENSWVAYSCIRRLSQDAAAVPILFLADPDDAESAVPDTHPTRRLFERPNPLFSGREFVEWSINTLNRRGEFFIMFDNELRPTMMYSHSDPKHWREVTSGGELIGWEYRHGSTMRTFLPQDVVHYRFINPGRPYRGLAPAAVVADALKTHTGADALSRNIIERGGEKAIIYRADVDLTEYQREQTVQQLRARHAQRNQVGRDVLLPNGVHPIDPKYIDDDLRLLDTAAAQPDKICAVYGVPKSLLGFEDIDKFATFEGRKRMLYTDTLMPMLAGVESAFDRMFVETLPSAYRCYVRFDWNAVPAMQEDTGSRFEVAGKAHAAGLPWAVCNERFDLGLDPDAIPGADTVMVNSMLAPLDKLIEQWSAPSASTPPDGARGAVPEGDRDAAPAKLTNATIRKRAGDTRARVQRYQRQQKRERAMSGDWTAMHGAALKVTLAKVKGDQTAAGVKAAIKAGFAGLSKTAAKLAREYHEASALEGELSIVELVEGKLDDSTRHAYKAVHQWRPDVEKFIRLRENLIVGLVDSELFDDITSHAVAAVKEGVEAQEMQHIIRTRWQSAPGGINRATTIARTEVGTAYNVARYTEMKGQGFTKHEWLTAGDEVVRTPPDSEFDHAACNHQIVKAGEARFACGLFYPMDPSGAPGNVINCRCETIPVVDERA